MFSSFTYLGLHNTAGSFRASERYGQNTHRQWEEHYARRMPTGPLPSPPFSGYIRIPQNFIINVLFFSIPKSYLEHIKAAGQYHGRLATVQEIWDQYTCRIIKEYQDFLLIVRLIHLSRLWLTLTRKRLLCFYREYTTLSPHSTLVETVSTL